MFTYILFYLTIPVKATRNHDKNCSDSAVSYETLRFFWVLVLLRFREEIRLFQKIEFNWKTEWFSNLTSLKITEKYRLFQKIEFNWKTEWFFIHFIKNHREISSKTLNLYMNLGSKRLELWKKDLKMLWNCLLKKENLSKITEKR